MRGNTVSTFIFALLLRNQVADFDSGCSYKVLERWVRGLNQQFAKLSYGLNRTGGSNPPPSAPLKPVS